MSTSLEHLLPGAEESIRCAQFARTLEVDSGGTAIRADRVVLVEVALPWPKPALSHPLVSDLAELAKRSTRPTRVLLTTPQRRTGSNRIVVLERMGGSASESHYRFDTADDARTVGQALLDTETRYDDGADGTGAPIEHELLVAHRPSASQAILICTQGSHDVCCGSEGERLAAEIEKIGRADLTIYRVSHTGGHRFAPTAMTIPDGRMWAGLNSETLLGVIDNTLDPAVAARFCRGWWGADTGEAQVAERAVFAEYGWSLDNQDRLVTIAVAGETMACVVETDEGSWDVQVGRGRVVPTIACREPGGQPVKPGIEYVVDSITSP